MKIRSAAGPNTISRENVRRKIVLSANVSSGDLRGIVGNDKRNSGYTGGNAGRLPCGIRRTVRKRTGGFENTHVGIAFSLLVIFLILYQEFKNLRLAGGL